MDCWRCQLRISWLIARDLRRLLINKAMVDPFLVPCKRHGVVPGVPNVMLWHLAAAFHDTRLLTRTEIKKLSRMRYVTISRMLDRLMDAGWLKDSWVDQPNSKYPLRYYRVTQQGATEFARVSGGSYRA